MASAIPTVLQASRGTAWVATRAIVLSSILALRQVAGTITLRASGAREDLRRLVYQLPIDVNRKCRICFNPHCGVS
jgi:hypothetical protein